MGDLRARFRHAAATLVAPGAARADETGRFDRAAFRQLGELGLLRALAPARFGGEGGGLGQLAAAIEGLVTGSDDLGFAVAIMAHLVAVQLLVEHGTEEQQERWLPPLLAGQWLAAVANAEPHAGTDVLGLRSRATAQVGGFLLSGRKRSITNVGEADLAIVSARLVGAARDSNVHAFVVELPASGAHARPIRDLAGLRSSPTGDLLLRRVSLPGRALLGAGGSGVELFRATFTWERLLTGYVLLATIRRALGRALAHAEEREQFGQAIGKNQHVQERIVRMHVAEELLSAQLGATLLALSAGKNVFGALSVSKIYGLEAALDAAQSLVRILGGRGLRRQAGAEKMVRDVLTLSVFGGTVELHKAIAYAELARAQRERSSSTDLEALHHAELSPELRAELIALVAEAFPGRLELAGRYFFDAAPDDLVVARRGGRVVGFRTLVYRELQVAGQPVQVVGIGIAVAPAHRRTGVGTLLTERALEMARQKQARLALAFLFTPGSGQLLRSAGFRPLIARFEYADSSSGASVVEASHGFAKALDSSPWLEAIEAQGVLNLGRGTW